MQVSGETEQRNTNREHSIHLRGQPDSPGGQGLSSTPDVCAVWASGSSISKSFSKVLPSNSDIFQERRSYKEKKVKSLPHNLRFSFKFSTTKNLFSGIRETLLSFMHLRLLGDRVSLACAVTIPHRDDLVKSSCSPYAY